MQLSPLIISVLTALIILLVFTARKVWQDNWRKNQLSKYQTFGMGTTSHSEIIAKTLVGDLEDRGWYDETSLNFIDATRKCLRPLKDIVKDSHEKLIQGKEIVIIVNDTGEKCVWLTMKNTTGEVLVHYRSDEYEPKNIRIPIGSYPCISWKKRRKHSNFLHAGITLNLLGIAINEQPA